jgi:hypothetical protein
MPGHFVLSDGSTVEPPEISFSDMAAFDREFRPLTFARFSKLPEEDRALDMQLFVSWCGLRRVGANVAEDFEKFMESIKDWVPAANGSRGKGSRTKKEIPSS